MLYRLLFTDEGMIKRFQKPATAAVLLITMAILLLQYNYAQHAWNMSDRLQAVEKRETKAILSYAFGCPDADTKFFGTKRRSKTVALLQKKKWNVFIRDYNDPCNPFPKGKKKKKGKRS